MRVIGRLTIILVAIAQPVSAQGPIIERVTVDASAERLTIVGARFGAHPIVQLAGVDLPVIEASDRHLVVEVGNDLLRQRGTYRLTAADGSTGVSDPFAVTFGIENSAAMPSVVESPNGTTTIGFQAMQSGGTGTLNTALGAQTLYNATTGGHNTAAGYQSLFYTTSGIGNTATGYQALANNTTANHNTAHGYQALFQNTTGPRNTAAGYRALYQRKAGASNTVFGFLAMVDSNSCYNTMIGQETGVIGSAGENTAVGYQALLVMNSPGAVAVGYKAAEYSRVGTTAIGYQAARGFGALSTYNTALGYRALLGATDGGENTAIGGSALRSVGSGRYSTAVGFQALQANSSQYNTAVGYNALPNNMTGDRNTGIGSIALGFSTGAGNTSLGYLAGLNNTAGNDSVFIAHQGENASNTMRIGTAQTRAFMAGIIGVTTGMNDAVPVVIDSAGQLGTISSSHRVKDAIADMGDRSRALFQLRPVTFQYRRAFADGTYPLQYGLIAEEVAEVMPDLVAVSADGQPETVKYHLLAAMLLNELQRQERTLQEMKTDAQKHDDNVRAAFERLARLEALFGAGR